MRAWLTVFFVAFLLWAALTVPWQPLQLAAGIPVAVVGAFLVRPLLPAGFSGIGPAQILGFLLFVPVFLWEMIRANLQIARVVLHPGLPIRPRLLRARTRLASDGGKTILANAITLTPGTLTVDVDDEGLLIHCVAPSAAEEETPEKLLSSFEGKIGRFAP